MNLKEKYQKEIVPKMQEKFSYKNKLAIPKIEKVVVNVGIGNYLKDKKIQNEIEKELGLIVGQKPVPTLSKKAISGFGIRQGMVVGFKSTLRRSRMYDFISRLINLALPRTRDFRGLSLKSVDQSGNLSIGIKESIIFPEVSEKDMKASFGLEVTVVTNAKTREEAIELFRLMGFPLKKE
ncbi:MAG: 50S ribosomal protein L5 [Candidatus Portnoybacteria bacterium]|nr:50S ribosomal protein L5 [Candidatus Portnoybacteria bacterium]